MRTYECPSCGSAVKFSAGATVFAVCEHCHSMVVRRDVRLEAIGRMAELPPDLSPLQIGTRGSFSGAGFNLVGRVRMAWEQGGWTEWYSVFDDGRTGWLAEAQGFFAISFASESTDIPKSGNNLSANSQVTIAGKPWRVVDRKMARCVAGEGELPFVAVPGAERTGIDLTSERGDFGTLEIYDDGALFYEGRYAEFGELGFQNLRPVPGWTPGETGQKNRQSRTLNCVACGAAVELRAEGFSVTCVCGSCGTILDASLPDVQLVQAAETTVRALKPAIPLGTRGTLDGVEYEVIGYVVRKDQYSSWSEYLLFNPWNNFAWLVTYNGHWSFVKRLLRPPAGDDSIRKLGGENFRKFADGDTRVQAVLGEFYWRVERGEVSRNTDFVAPPKILSRESYPDLNEVTWSLGEYRTPSEITKAFALKEPLPRASGPYLHESNPYVTKWQRVWPVTALAVLLLIVMQLASLVFMRKQLVYGGNFDYVSGNVAVEGTTSEPFDVRSDGRPLWVELEAPVFQNWIEVDIDLVNTTTGQTRSDSVSASYYAGTDSDGEWSEGSRKGETVIPSVPAGTYFLRVSPSADKSVPRMSFKLTASSGGIFWTNLFVALGLILLYPIWVLYRSDAFEKRRWAESDFG